MNCLQRLFQNVHRKSRGAYGNIAGALSHAIGAHHAGTCIALRRCQQCARLQISGRVQKPCPFFCQTACTAACRKYPRQDVSQLPRLLLHLFQAVKFCQHPCIIGTGSLIHWEHAGSIAYAQHLLATQLPMDIACQSGKEAYFRHMRLLVQHCLIKVGNAPALGNIEAQCLGQLICRLSCNIVPPSAEWHQQLILCIKRQIAVHHGTDAHCTDFLKPDAVFFLHAGSHRPVAGLNPLPRLC